MKNEDIRNEIKKSGLFYWEIAEAIGMNDGNFSRILRRELSKEEKAKIRKAIETLRKREGI